MKAIILSSISILLFSYFTPIVQASAQTKNKDEKKTIRYKSGKRIDFQSLLIEGEKKKADYSVVTGNLGETDLGLLKLRKDFNDHMALDHKEEI